ISSADARGVMQITPGTWSWISQDLAGPPPLAPESALENVRAGALLLHSLLESSGGNQSLAIAGYYQDGRPCSKMGCIHPPSSM
ncbi:MAG: lytic transglycosylase domain-containing protein, partial [Solirubrobacteraceae bacterium]